MRFAGGGLQGSSGFSSGFVWFVEVISTLL